MYIGGIGLGNDDIREGGGEENGGIRHAVYGWGDLGRRRKYRRRRKIE